MGTVILDKAGTRRFLAAVFVLLLFAEFGSHGLICSGDEAADGQSVSATDPGHEDPCATLIQCGYDQNNRRPPTLGHDASQHNALFDRLSDLTAQAVFGDEQPLLSETASPIFRPPDPPFHPPKFS